MEKCVAYGTLNTQQTGGRRDIAVGERSAYGVVEGKQQIQNNEDDVYKTTTPSLQTKGKFYISEPMCICIAIKHDIIYADFWSFPFLFL